MTVELPPDTPRERIVHNIMIGVAALAIVGAIYQGVLSLKAGKFDGVTSTVSGWWHSAFPEPTRETVYGRSVTYQDGKPTYLLRTVDGRTCQVDAPTYDRDSTYGTVRVSETCDWRAK